MPIQAHPTVSVVLPTYNRAALLSRSIRSVLNQSYRDFELLVIDDGSNDDTGDVVSGFCDPRLSCVRLPNNIGAGPARNVGIRMSRGKFLAFQDSDDEWFPEKLASQLSVFDRNLPRLGIVYSDMERVLRNGAIHYHTSPEVVKGRLINSATQFYQVCMLGIQSTLIRRECLEVAGPFDERLPALEDLELFMRLSNRFDFFRIPQPLVRYHETEGLSKDQRAKWIARRRIVKLYFWELLLHDTSFFFKECSWIFKTRSDRHDPRRGAIA